MILRLATRRKPTTPRIPMPDQPGDLAIKAAALREAADAWESLGQPVQRSPIGVWLRCRATQVENASEQLHDSNHAAPKPCPVGLRLHRPHIWIDGGPLHDCPGITDQPEEASGR